MPLALMGDRTFVALWMTGAIVNVIRWLEVLAIGVFAFDLTGSPLVVSFLLLVRTVPMSVVGFWPQSCCLYYASVVICNRYCATAPCR